MPSVVIPRFLIAWQGLTALALSALVLPGAQAQTGLLQFSSLAYSVKESAGAAKITVTRTGGSSGTLTVDFATVDSGGGTATAGEDYYPTNGTLTFGPGVTSRFFYVPILDDPDHEPNETVIVELHGAALGARINATLTILDNDGCAYAINPTSQTLDSGGGLAPAITVTATPGCDWTVVENVDWVAITEGASGTGNGQVVYSFDPNPDTGPRTATLTIAGLKFTITQRGVPGPDLTPPVVTLQSPAAGSRQTNSEITVTGTAADDVGVTLVEVRLENAHGIGDYVPATGTANWTATLSGLVPGTNTIRVRASDAENAPTEVTRSIFYVEVRPLTLTTIGQGTISPLVNGQQLEVGRSYALFAKPARSNFFSGWTGSIESSANPLNFDMQEDLTLQANFVFTPFIPIAGTYNGLFYETDVVRHERSGFLTAKVAELGSFTAKMILGGKRFSFTGKFALDGKTTNSIPRGDSSPLTVVLCLDLLSGTDQIVGVVGDTNWQATLLADRARFDARTNPAPQAGPYTFIVPGNPDDAANQPGGDSFATVTVGSNGSVKLGATLADQTKATQKVALSKSGSWPLYVPLYGGKGSILSWLAFTDSLDSDLTGTLSWIKPALPGAKLYRSGFALPFNVSGSHYRPPTNSTDRVLGFTDGTMTFTMGSDHFENAVAFTNDNKLINLASNKLTLIVTRPTGLFRGTVTPPGTSRSVSFNGALHQKGQYGSGFFTGTNQTGRAHLGP